MARGLVSVVLVGTVATLVSCAEQTSDKVTRPVGSGGVGGSSSNLGGTAGSPNIAATGGGANAGAGGSATAGTNTGGGLVDAGGVVGVQPAEEPEYVNAKDGAELSEQAVNPYVCGRINFDTGCLMCLADICCVESYFCAMGTPCAAFRHCGNMCQLHEYIGCYQDCREKNPDGYQALINFITPTDCIGECYGNEFCAGDLTSFCGGMGISYNGYCDDCLSENCCDPFYECMNDSVCYACYQNSSSNSLECITNASLQAFWQCASGVRSDQCGKVCNRRITGICDSFASLGNSYQDTCATQYCCDEFAQCTTYGATIDECFACIETGEGERCAAALACVQANGCVPPGQSVIAGTGLSYYGTRCDQCLQDQCGPKFVACYEDQVCKGCITGLATSSDCNTLDLLWDAWDCSQLCNQECGRGTHFCGLWESFGVKECDDCITQNCCDAAALCNEEGGCFSCLAGTNQLPDCNTTEGYLDFVQCKVDSCSQSCP